MKKLISIAVLTCSLLEVFAQNPTKEEAELDSLYQTLPELLVKGERPVVKAQPGKLVYDMPRLLVNKPVDNIYEALKELPGVTEMNEALSLGGIGVTIVLDGKVTNMTTAQLMALLKSMPSNRIKNVEIMYNAPARYQVRGAMINIILNHDPNEQQPLQGEWYSLFRQKHVPSMEERLSLLWNKGKFSTDFLYTYNFGKVYHISDDESIHHLQNGEVYQMNTMEKYKGFSNEHSVRWGLDYRWNDKHALSLVYNFSNDHTKNNSILSGIVQGDNYLKSEKQLHDLRFDYQTPFGLKAGVEMTYYKAPEQQRMNSRLQEEERHYSIENNQKINKWKFFLSQEHQLKKNWSINYGVIYNTIKDYSYQFYHPTSKNTETLPDDMAFHQKEDNLDIYAGFSKSFSEKLMLDASLDAYYYKSAVWDEWKFYPTINLSYLPSDGHTFQLGLSSNRAYPSYWSVKSFKSYTKGGYGEILGNPMLKPSSTYQLQLAYVLKNKYTFVTWMSRDDDKFTQLVYQRTDRLVMEYKFHNFDFSDTFGVQASIPFKPFKWWQVNLTLVGALQRDKYDGFYDIPFDRRIFWTMFNLRNTFVLSSKPDVSMTVNGFYRTKAIQGNYDLPSSGTLDLGLRYQFAQKRATFRLYLNDAFQTTAIYPVVRIDDQNYRMHYSCFREFGLSFNYAFGGYKAKNRAAVDTSRFK